MIFFERLIRLRILQHMAFWSISLYLLLNHFQTSSELSPTDYIYTGIFAVFLISAVYINLLLLLPRLFQEGRYLYYILFSAFTIALVVYLQIILFDVFVAYIFPGYYLISYIDYWQTLQYFIIFVGVSSLLHFSKSWFLYKEAEAKLAESQKENIKAELKVLRNQINPHFLFNSLNSIYSLVLKKSANAPDVLIKLSDAMRYIIYEANSEVLALQKEIDFITNYIDLKRLRNSAKDKLEYSISGDVKDQKIAPLLLIPIIENCFKYGIKGETDSSFVDIKISIGEFTLSMIARNNIGKVDNMERNKSKGTGIENLKKRLELIYPKSHNLQISDSNNIFLVDLSINI